MFYRYELYFDNEYQGVGFLQGLSELDLSDEKTEYLLYHFDKALPIPPINMRKTCSFFTEFGNQFFEKDISDIIYEYEEDKSFEVRKIVLEENQIDKNLILYQDEYQIILKENFEREKGRGE